MLTLFLIRLQIMVISPVSNNKRMSWSFSSNQSNLTKIFYISIPLTHAEKKVTDCLLKGRAGERERERVAIGFLPYCTTPYTFGAIILTAIILARFAIQPFLDSSSRGCHKRHMELDKNSLPGHFDIKRKHRNSMWIPLNQCGSYYLYPLKHQAFNP